MGSLRLLVLVLGIELAACNSAPRAKTAFDQRVDFAAYKTFAMMHPNHPVPSSRGLDPFTLHRLRQMTFSMLKQRGLEPVADTEAQLRVSVDAEPRLRTEVIPASTWAPYPRHYYGAEVRTFETVMLEVNIVDASRGGVV